jgi:antitoxin component YwqK of YwqJK toxin-antitoxin module
MIELIAAICMLHASPLLAQEAVTITAVPGNPWNYNSELIFKQSGKEIAKQHAGEGGNITPVTGSVPDGLTVGYFPDGKRMMEIPFKHNRADGIAHSFYEGTLIGDEVYRRGILNGTQTGYYLNGQIKTQGEWRNGKPVGLHKLFDEHRHLEMTTRIKGNNRTETHFYPDARKKSTWTYKHGTLAEASEYGEDGALRVHANRFARLDECRVSSEKPQYASGEAIGLYLSCRCERSRGCFSPDLGKQGLVHSGWTKHLMLERDGTQYRPVYCPMSAMVPIDLYSRFLFKDGEQIAHTTYMNNESPNECGTRWVSRSAYDACSGQFDCISRLFNAGIASLPVGEYIPLLDAGSEPSKISFRIR